MAIVQILTWLFLWIDGILLRLLKWVYGIMEWIADTTIFSDTIIGTIGQRIGAFIGIFMLFRLTFSLVEYIVNPEKANDKSNGGGKIIFDILFSLILLILVNTIFQQAYKLQWLVLEENVLGNVIFGVEGGKNRRSADEFTFDIYSALIYPNPDLVGTSCDGVYSGDGDVVMECFDALVKLNVSQNVMDLYRDSIEKKDPTKLVHYTLHSENVKDSNGDNTSVFYYIPILTTGVGIVALLMVINVSIDAAVRSVKLGFLQLIAPIPILSNAIPGPKGKEMFKKWYTNCISTYLGLFLKLIVFYFAVYLIGLVGASGFYSASGMSQSTSPNILGKIFVILGVLMFVNQLPQLISDITGAKMDGDFTLNPMKKIGQSTFASAAVGGAAGLLGGAAANTWANIVNTKKAHSKILDNHGNKIKYKNMTDEQKRQFKEMGGRHGLQFAGSFLGGAAGGAFQSGKSMVANKGQFFRSLGTGVGASSDNRRRRDNGFGFGDRISSYAHDAAGLTNKSGTSSQIKKQMFDLQQEAAGRREWVASAKHNLELEAANSAYSSGYRYLSEQLTYIGPDEDGNPKYMGGTDHPEYSDYFAKTGAISNVTDFEAEAKSGRFVGESWYEDLIKSGASVDSMYDSYLDSRGVMTEETFESVADQYRNIGTRQAEAADYDKKVKDLQDTLDKKPQPKK